MAFLVTPPGMVRPDPISFGLETMKFLGGAGILVDDQIPTQALLELYIQYVVPHLPRTPTDMVDD